MQADLLRVTIVGAGIGGLTAAIALQRKGVRVQLIERVAELKPVGAGITLQSNAVQALDRIGLAESARQSGAVMQQVSIRLQNEQTITQIDLKQLAAELGQPNVCIHRGLLQQLLIDALEDTELRTGVEVESWEEHHDSISLQLTDGTEHRCDALIGADGLRSKTRARLWGDVPLRSAGYTSWRGICPNRGLVPNGHAVESWGSGQRFGYLPVDSTCVYWFATDATSNESISKEVDKNRLISRFIQWHQPIAKILGRTNSADIVGTDILDLHPFRPWGRGPVTLLGDAAHAMTPNLGQGGGQAIEDAVTLATWLESAENVDHWLRSYERRRYHRTRQFVNRSRLLGYIAQGNSGLLRSVRNGLFRWMPASINHAQMRRMLTFNS